MAETFRPSTGTSMDRPQTSSPHQEGRLARSIEQQTARLPSDTFLWLALGSMATSAAFQIGGAKNVSLFIGQWAPAFLLFGVYNKLVKQHGTDRTENQHQMAH